MGFTITEKILQVHSQRKGVSPGEFIHARVDVSLGNDITAPIAIEEFEREGFKKVFHKEKIVLVPDHFTPNKDIRSAMQCKMVRDFATRYKIKHYFEIGRMGIEHALLPESGFIAPGDVIIGADSHTCTYGALGAFSTGVGSTDLAGVWATGRCWFRVPETIKFVCSGKLKPWVGGKDIILYIIGDIGVDGALYKTMEFSGTAIRELSMDDRFTMCNMAIEAGAKNGIIEPDETTIAYLKEVKRRNPQSRLSHTELRLRNFSHLNSDQDAHYNEIREYTLHTLEPQVAAPHLPSNVQPVGTLKRVKIDQALIGSCTNGRISDLRIAAQILKGKKVHSRVRLIVIPATQRVYLQAVQEGLVEIFINAGGIVSTPTCGPCLGGHLGVLAQGERAIATTNRNFRGRMGHLDSEVYLSNAAVAAASAIKGRITHPGEVR
jgi:3-isopropylmalate/(R)-2-methylmalate dehydratase large subunit